MSETATPKSGTAPALHAKTETRIARRFRELAAARETGLVAYITAGDPSLDASLAIVLAADEAGADVIELGVPFSDPVADGPTIQRASERALLAGATMGSVIELVRRIRKQSEVPLVLFSYFNPILQYGLDRFAKEAAVAGADGVLATDLTLEEASDYYALMHAHGLDTIFLAAPTSTDERLKKISALSSGFLYMISRTGVTGARDKMPDELPALTKRARRFTKLPIAVGFGISQPDHIAALAGVADAAVVGSALMSEIENAATPDGAAAAIGAKIRTLKQATRKLPRG